MPKKQKLKGVTFNLVHRSQQDPLVADDTAPQRVLVPVETKLDREKRLEEQHKHGVYFDDDSNYLQYLKDPDDNKMDWPEHVEVELQKRKEEKAKAKLNLPSSVFASEIEEKEGMLSKAAPVSGPQLHLDPELVAAMDEDFDYDDPDNELEDNFIELAQGVASDEEFDEHDEDDYMESDIDSDERRDDVGSLKGSDQSFDKEETKSRFTNYSMSSSVIRRNEQLTLLDDKFEKMYAEYDDNEIGALDTEEIEGEISVTDNMLLQFADEFEKEKKGEHLDKANLRNKIMQLVENSQNKPEETRYVEVPKKPQWDCKSILSTYSNLYNHPKLIVDDTPPKKNKIKVDKRTGIPMNTLDTNKLTLKNLARFNEMNGDETVVSQLAALSVRPKHETSEGKRERKKALKEYRKEKRIEKKATILSFKEEDKVHKQISSNKRSNQQGNKIL